MDLILGSANFGVEYGLNKKKISDLNDILIFLSKSKIKMIDTAFSYRKSHKIITDNLLYNKKIITKLDLKKNLNQIYKLLVNFSCSLKNNKIYGVLIHNIGDFVQFKKKKELLSILKLLKKKKKIKKIGVSLYSIKELKYVLNYFVPSIIQIPLNVFDNRFFESRWFIRLVKKNKIEVHARSCFLQGLLLKKNIPSKFLKFKNQLNNFFKWCDLRKITYLEGCLNFVKRFRYVNYVVVGVENISQLKEIYYIFYKKKYLFVPSFNKNIADKLIDPRLW